MTKAIQIKQDWERILDQMESYDFYHTYDYHMISKNADESPVLIIYEADDITIAIPLLLRKIQDTPYYDATSVYGYAGPLINATQHDFDHSLFRKTLNTFLNDKKIISVFSRLNPYISKQEYILNNIGTLGTIGKVVNIDLTQTLEEQRTQYRKDTKSRVNKARRLCTVKKAESKDDIKAFIAIYRETMQKLNADSSYFFKDDYFFNFLNCHGFTTTILLAIHNESGEVIAGSMFVKTNSIIQYHLSGTKTEYMKIAPSRLLLDEMRIQGTKENYTYLNLGGGYQGNNDDLYNFKSSFSKDAKPFSVWKYIVNENVYKELCEANNSVESNFFPAYRAPSQNI